MFADDDQNVSLVGKAEYENSARDADGERPDENDGEKRLAFAAFAAAKRTRDVQKAIDGDDGQVPDRCRAQENIEEDVEIAHENGELPRTCVPRRRRRLPFVTPVDVRRTHYRTFFMRENSRRTGFRTARSKYVRRREMLGVCSLNDEARGEVCILIMPAAATGRWSSRIAQDVPQSRIQSGTKLTFWPARCDPYECVLTFEAANLPWKSLIIDRGRTIKLTRQSAMANEKRNQLVTVCSCLSSEIEAQTSRLPKVPKTARIESSSTGQLSSCVQLGIDVLGGSRSRCSLVDERLS